MTSQQLAEEIKYYRFMARCMAIVAEWNRIALVDNAYGQDEWSRARDTKRCLDAADEAAEHYARARQLMGLE